MSATVSSSSNSDTTSSFPLTARLIPQGIKDDRIEDITQRAAKAAREPYRAAVPQILTAMLHGEADVVCEGIDGLSHRMALRTPISQELTFGALHRWVSKNPYTDPSRIFGIAELVDPNAGGLERPRSPQKAPKLRDYQNEMILQGECTVPFERLLTLEHPLLPKQPGGNEIDLRTKMDEEIFEHAIIPKKGAVLRFGNWRFGGKCPNIALTISMPLKNMWKVEYRERLLEESIRSHSLNVPANILDLTAVSLIEELATQINGLDLSLEEKEEKLESVILDIVTIFVNRIEGAHADLFQFEKVIPLAQEYVYYANAIPNAGHIVLPYGGSKTITQISLDAFIQQGGADCRGTNCLFAVLLNAGFAKIGSSNEARLLYAKNVIEPTVEKFNDAISEDHNMVLIKKGEGFRMGDARFLNIHKMELRKMITGVVDEYGSLNQISGALPFMHPGLANAALRGIM